MGAVRDGRMAALRGTSAKLRARAVRNLSALLGLSQSAARRRLEAAGWDMRPLLDKVPPPGARAAREKKGRGG